MKKMMVVLMLGALSVASFAYGGNGRGDMKKGNGKHKCERQENRRHKFEKGFDVEVLKKIGVSDTNIKKATEIKEKAHKEAKLRRLEIKEKEIELEREQLSENKNWSAIEIIIEDIAELRAKQKIARLKTKDTLEKILPLDKYYAIKREGRKENRKNKLKGNGNNEIKRNR